MSSEALYFGVLVKDHYLYHEKIKSLDRLDPNKILTFPWNIYQLDTGLLESWKIPDIPDGRVHWTKNGFPLWFAFCWWDRSGDKRTKSNSGFYVKGFNQNEHYAAFSYACSKFPEVTYRQRPTLVLQSTEARC